MGRGTVAQEGMLLQVLDSDAKLPPTFKDELYQAIAAASGAVQKEEAKARKAVATEGEERTGTGPFDNLTMEAHVNIFSALGLRDRLTVSIAVRSDTPCSCFCSPTKTRTIGAARCARHGGPSAPSWSCGATSAACQKATTATARGPGCTAAA